MGTSHCFRGKISPRIRGRQDNEYLLAPRSDPSMANNARPLTIVNSLASSLSSLLETEPHYSISIESEREAPLGCCQTVQSQISLVGEGAALSRRRVDHYFFQLSAVSAMRRAPRRPSERRSLDNVLLRASYVRGRLGSRGGEKKAIADAVLATS